jgi:trehalose 2-sulfotransferase
MDYIVAAVPRTGSTMLCGLLARNGAGRPGEHLNPEVPAGPFSIAVARRIPTESYLAAVRSADTVGGIFGTKLMPHWLPTIEACCAKRNGDYADMLRLLFPDARYIFLRRRNIVAAAVSLSMAMATGQWGGPEDTTSTAPAVPLDEVHRTLMWLRRHEAEWTDLLCRVEARAHELYYEDLLEAPAETVREVLMYVGLRPAEVEIESGTEVQRGQAATELENRYLAWLGREHGPWYEANPLARS